MNLTLEQGQDNPILRTPGTPVETFDAQLRKLAEAMHDMMVKAEGVGLAAPQIGTSLRLFVATKEHMPLDVQKSAALNDEVMAVVNPLLLNTQGADETMVEGCLSLPDILVEVARPETVTIQAQNIEGERFTTTISGYASRILQHEMDHLEGILISDKGRTVEPTNSPAL